MFREELEQLARDRHVTMIVVAGDHADPAAKHLLSPSHLQEPVPDLAGRDVYISGPPTMTRSRRGTSSKQGQLANTSIPKRSRCNTIKDSYPRSKGEPQ